MTIAVSCGDVNGIALEVFSKAVKKLNHFKYNLFINKKILEKSNISFPNCVNIININCKEFNIELGKVSTLSGMHSVESIVKATESVIKGESQAILTLPISKEATQLSGWQYPGHTDYFAQFAKSSELMILTDLKIHVALATIHIPINKVAESITIEKLLDKIQTLNNTLIQDINLQSPRIAVLGLNPHAGENGKIGNEENSKVTPAIANAKKLGINADGPFPADGFFASKQYLNYDGILAMYHDQGLIPLKMLAYPGGVNYTAGLSIIRVSPDHGTAFNIAGKNIADPQSVIDSIKLAAMIYINRMK